LTGEILNAIAQASIVSDPDLSIMALRDFIFGAQRQAGRA
jgi:hypothetical protein